MHPKKKVYLYTFQFPHYNSIHRFTQSDEKLALENVQTVHEAQCHNLRKIYACLMFIAYNYGP